MKIESLIKKNYKIYIISAVVFSAVAGIFFYTGSSYTGTKHFSGKISMTLENYYWYIYGGAILLLIICILLAMFVKIARVNKILSTYNIDEINRSLNNNDSGKYMKMSVFLTNKFLISTDYPNFIYITDIHTIKVSSYNTCAITIKINLMNGQEIIFYSHRIHSKNTDMTQMIRDELFQFNNKLRKEFPNINLISDI